jgi:hypothetical protein
VPGTSDGSLTFNLVFPCTWLPHSLSFCQSVCPLGLFFLSTSNPFSLFLYNLCSILVFYLLTSILLLLLIISALLIWFDNVLDLLTGIWFLWARLVGNVLLNDKVHCILEIKIHFFISRKRPASCPLLIEKKVYLLRLGTHNGNIPWGSLNWCPDKPTLFFLPYAQVLDQLIKCWQVNSSCCVLGTSWVLFLSELVKIFQ